MRESKRKQEKDKGWKKTGKIQKRSEDKSKKNQTVSRRANSPGTSVSAASWFTAHNRNKHLSIRTFRLGTLFDKIWQWVHSRRTVPGSIPGGVIWDYFRGSFRQNHVQWGRLSLWKWVPGISPGEKAAGVFGWRPTTLVVVPKVEKIRGLNLPGNPRAISDRRGIPLLTLHKLELVGLSLLAILSEGLYR